MLKKVLFLLLFSLCFSCGKKQQTAACGTQTCTAVFTTIGIHFTDNAGKPIGVLNFSAINQRTHIALTNTGSMGILFIIGYYLVADDSALSQLSTEGDDILISATNPNTNQTKTAIVKISGGCTCHVAKLSGPDVIAFD